ncbi:MAG: hypothetical protein KIS67_13295 [Verrucomicrobiae bacterium]|nr:hypothetical protein [Verrucomicrobiae bacterium]
MNRKERSRFKIAMLAGFVAGTVCGQGTFQNLDFENGSLIPIPGDPFGRVQFSPAMPGWTGYVGTNQIDWILHNNLFLGTAGIAIWGPDQPPDFFNGQYYVVLQNPLGVPTDVPAISQTGSIPPTALSLRFLTADAFAVGFSVSFAGQQIPLSYIGQNNQFTYIWGGDISAFAGQAGELRFRGSGYLDSIQFSHEPIPEPTVLGMFAFGALLLCWRFVCRCNPTA